MKEPSHVDLKPLQNNLLVEPSEAAQKIGSIFVPEAHQRKMYQGKVLEKGPLCSDAINVGEVVCYSMHSESPLNYGGKSYIFVPEENCLGKITPVSKS